MKKWRVALMLEEIPYRKRLSRILLTAVCIDGLLAIVVGRMLIDSRRAARTRAECLPASEELAFEEEIKSLETLLSREQKRKWDAEQRNAGLKSSLEDAETQQREIRAQQMALRQATTPLRLQVNKIKRGEEKARQEQQRKAEWAKRKAEEEAERAKSEKTLKHTQAELERRFGAVYRIDDYGNASLPRNKFRVHSLRTGDKGTSVEYTFEGFGEAVQPDFAVYLYDGKGRLVCRNVVCWIWDTVEPGKVTTWRNSSEPHPEPLAGDTGRPRFVKISESESAKRKAEEEAERAKREAEMARLGGTVDAMMFGQTCAQTKALHPSTVKFPGFANGGAELDRDSGIWTVWGTVEAKNAFGLALRYRYVVKCKKEGPERWREIHFAMSEEGSN